MSTHVGNGDAAGTVLGKLSPSVSLWVPTMRSLGGARSVADTGWVYNALTKCRRKYCIFFVIHNMCIEKKMEPFNSGELKKIFRNISCIHLIGLIASGMHAWQEEKENISGLY